MHDEHERPRLLRRADAIAAWAMDGAVALVALPFSLLVFGREHRPVGHLHVLLVAGAAVLSAAPLLVRRRWPVRVLAVTLVVGLVVPGTAFSPAALIALFTVAALRPWRQTQAAALITLVTFALHRVIGGYSLPFVLAAAQVVLCSLAVALGLYQSTRLAYLDQLRERARRLERERELLSEQAAAEERLRIARELHDVVAHNVSLMVVQAQALGAKAAVETAPDLAADAGRRSDIVQTAGTIAELGRDAMSEMHRTLALMRPSGSEPERAPPPTLDGIDRLLEQARSAGVPVQLHVRGEPRTLEPSLELSAYRIVQEALTNVVKHAGSARTEVTVRYGPTELELEVIDEGPSVSPAGDGSGHGLIGMRERAALFGGELYAGPRPAGGYRVAARLPLAPAGGPRR